MFPASRINCLFEQICYQKTFNAMSIHISYICFIPKPLVLFYLKLDNTKDNCICSVSLGDYNAVESYKLYTGYSLVYTTGQKYIYRDEGYFESTDPPTVIRHFLFIQRLSI